MGKTIKVRKGNDDSKLRFSRKLERAHEWLVGDSGAGCSVIANTNADLLTDIQDAPDEETMTIHYNSGVTTTGKQGHLKGYGLVWHNPNGIANIISLGECSTRYRITMDTDIDNVLSICVQIGRIGP